MREIHAVQNVHVSRAFHLRGVAEQVRRNSSSVIAKAVIQRLVFLQDFSKRGDGTSNSPDERMIRKQTRHLQEVFGYVKYYLDQSTGSDQTMTGAQTLFLDVFEAGLKTLVAILQSSEHFRYALLSPNGWSNCWNMLVELLHRCNVRLRTLICQVMTFCMVEMPPSGNPVQTRLSTADRQWNIGMTNLIMNTDSRDVLFFQRHADWGWQATGMTICLVVQVRRTVVFGRNPRNLPFIGNLDVLLYRYYQHQDVLLERYRLLKQQYQVILEDDDAITADIRNSIDK